MSSAPLPSGPGSGPIPARAGIGLRFAHHRAVLDGRPGAAWFEVHAENYMGGGEAIRILDSVRRDYPVSLHGIGLSLGSAEGINALHLLRVKALAERVQPGLISEHLSWSASGGTYLADLLPLPMTEEALDIVCRNIDIAQSALGQRILIENPSSYLRFRHSILPEWEFLAAVAARTGCGILCDVNNIFVSASNHGWDALAYLDALPAGAIGEFHLAGHTARELEDGRVLRIDDHGSAVAEPVWELYEAALARFGARPTLIEWDNRIPEFAVLMGEAARAQTLLDRAEGARHADAA